MIPLPSRRSVLLLLFVAVAVTALVVRRASWSPDDFRDLHDSVAEHERLALSPGHAALLESGRCTVCHVSHSAQERRALWGGERASGAGFIPASIDSGGGKTGMCLSCHDGATARPLTAHAGPAYGMASAAGPDMASAHPVGVDYMAAVRRDPGSYNDPFANPRIVLEDGKVGCVSCHATHDAATVAAGSVRHEVCVECHRR